MRQLKLPIVTLLASSLLGVQACEDPQVAASARAEAAVKSAADAVTIAAQRASVDRVAAADDLRRAAEQAAAISGGTSAQQRAARDIVASARTQAALLELGWANRMESSYRSSRSLAHGLAGVASQIQAVGESHRPDSLNPTKDALEPRLSSVEEERRHFDQDRSAIQAQVEELRASSTQALSEAEALLAEAEATRQRGLSAGRGEITVIAEQAGALRDRAREFQTKAASAEADLNAQESQLRQLSSEGDGAGKRADALAAALAALDSLQSSYREMTVHSSEMLMNFKLRVLDLAKATDPLRDPAIKECFDRIAADLDAAEAAASAGSSNELNVKVARARALLAQAQAHFQQAQLVDWLAHNPCMANESDDLGKQAQAQLKASEELTLKAIDAYTAAKELLANAGEGSAATKGLAATIDRAIATIKVPSLDALPEVAPPAATPDESASDAPAAGEPSADEAPAAATDSSGPPFATPAALAAFITSLGSTPDDAARYEASFTASTPEGQSFVKATTGMAVSLLKLQGAMKAKFGSANLGPLQAIADGAKGQATVGEETDTTATLVVSNPQGSQTIIATKTDDGWKVDGDATWNSLDDATKMQFTAASAMAQGLLTAIDGVTSGIEDGSVADPQAAVMALMQALQGAMGGQGAP